MQDNDTISKIDIGGLSPVDQGVGIDGNSTQVVTVAPLHNEADFAPDREKTSVGIFGLVSTLFQRNPMQNPALDKFFTDAIAKLQSGQPLQQDAVNVVVDLLNIGHGLASAPSIIVGAFGVLGMAEKFVGDVKAVIADVKA